MDVMQHRVTVVEGTAAGVLAGEAHRHPFPEQGGKGERLGVSPIDPYPLLHCCQPLAVERGQLGMRGKIVRETGQLFRQTGQDFSRYGSRLAGWPVIT